MSHFYATLGKFQFILLPVLSFLQLHIQFQKFVIFPHIVSFKLFISLLINSDMHLYTQCLQQWIVQPMYLNA